MGVPTHGKECRPNPPSTGSPPERTTSSSKGRHIANASVSALTRKQASAMLDDTDSFLIKNMLVDWREGERWFWDTLVDADAASNPFGWQRVADSGADAAPYSRMKGSPSKYPKVPTGTGCCDSIVP